jgi:hypothetical protein
LQTGLRETLEQLRQCSTKKEATTDSKDPALVIHNLTCQWCLPPPNYSYRGSPEPHAQGVGKSRRGFVSSAVVVRPISYWPIVG